MKVAVVGLGVLGASVARSLAVAGASVTVLERSEPLAGTSGTTFAWVNSHGKNPLPYHQLNVAGMHEHAVLARSVSGQPAWYHRTGNLEWAGDEEGAERLARSVAQLRDRDYPVQWLTPGAARELVPDLRVPPGVRYVAYYPTEGYVLPPLLVARLWGEARDAGAELLCPAHVVAVTERGDGVRLALADGGEVRADAVVLAAGRWSDAVASSAGHRVPLADPDVAGSATVGFLGWTTPVAARLDRVLTTPNLNVRPDGGGRLVVQGLDLDADADPARPPTPDGEHARTLLTRLAALIDGTDGARLTSLRVGQRALPADGLPVCGFLGERHRVYALVSHSGITLGPLLGRLAAQEILREEPSDLLADFRPQRWDGVDPAELPALRPARLAGQQ
ncbi:NAD(P)/FAD-dependent oxidoreductase [Saccharomonospora azurea]|uniref:Glycine/D-amino acid oxidase, deaminating n=1 Tax=Saccharomonospora azurea NA-128 TaxID=882081 RepID=H8G6Y3_9PSEU|nr:FAD-binding oxidoreductase [Saccharomonospora azurea]EHY87252.1 glycine/D-amino acid oxidase, deaminating [Saccharomonospora azurea NA-128]